MLQELEEFFRNIKDLKKQPEYFVTKHYVKVTLYNRNFINEDLNKNNVVSKKDISNENSKNLNQKELRYKKILNLMIEKNSVSYEEIIKELNILKATLQRDINDLKKKNIIKNKGNTRKNHWEI
ncbi:DeoR family transcriptional regulator [Metamycoplasma alkalescens]|uniref:DeoR family transcriptional regulator n=1 Tax=Metamycoplasma alkalescens TaxID=45363 RepID=UPI001EE692B8|nr:DeoR family transcriptional regulator [Metamycoplasma alkalescens]